MRSVVFFAILFAAAPAIGAGRTLTADYVEARTASVFAGACHYNGEVVTTGREAVLAWNVRNGSWKGVDLRGCRVVAVVRSDRALGEKGARISELTLDAPTEAQAEALLDAWRAEYGAALGDVVAVRRGAVSFDRSTGSFRVDAPGFAGMSVDALPNDACCKMPNLVWYEPLVPVEGRRVGYTHHASYAGGAVGSRWERADENSAFYGTATIGK